MELEQWAKIFADLEENGIVNAIDPQPIVRDNDELITNATLIDCDNEKFIHDIDDALFYSLKIKDKLTKSNFPNNRLSKFDIEFISSRYYPSYAFGWQIGIRGMPPTLKNIWFTAKDQILDKPTNQFEPRSMLTREFMDENFVDENGSYFLKPRYAGSLAMNRAMVTSIRLGLPLVTDNPIFQTLITQKCRKIFDYLKLQKDSTFNEEKELIIDYLGKSQRELFNNVLITKKDCDNSKRFSTTESERIVSLVLSNLISYEALSKISLKEIIEYRGKSQDARERLLIVLYQWANDIEEMIKDNTYDLNEMSNKIYKTQVLPEVEKYKHNLRKINRKLVPTIFGTMSEQLGLSLTTTTVGSLIAGLTLEQMLILSIAVASPIIGKTIKEVLSYNVRREEVKNDSPIAYLLNVPNI